MGRDERKTRAYALNAGEGWQYRFGIDFTLKASEIHNGNGAAFMEYVTRKGEEPPSHTHGTEDEMFYVLEGAITFQCGEETFDLEKGGCMFLPAGIEHGYTIGSNDPVRLLVISAPPRPEAQNGWGGFVADLESGQGKLIAKPPHED